MDKRYPIATLIKYFEEIEKQNIPIEEVLKSSDIKPYQAFCPRTEITQEQDAILMNNIARFNRDKHLGFNHGQAQNPACYGLAIHSVLASENVLEACQRLQRLEPYYQQDQRIRMNKISVNEKYGLIQFDLNPDFKESQSLIIESKLISLCNIFHTFLGIRPKLSLLKLPYSQPRHYDLYHQYFSCPIQFDSNKLEVWLSKKELEKRSINHDPLTASFLENLILDRSKTRVSNEAFINKVRNTIEKHGVPFPSLEELASLLHMSSRTLRRKLERCDTSYQKLIDSIKFSVAEKYILHTDLSIEEIAYQAGYKSPSSFGYSFKQRTGQTPRMYRRSIR